MKIQLAVGPTGTDHETWEFVDRHCHVCGRAPMWVRTDAPASGGQPHLCLACGATARVTPVEATAETARRMAAIAASIGARAPFAPQETPASMSPPAAGQFARFAREIGRIVQKLR